MLGDPRSSLGWWGINGKRVVFEWLDFFIYLEQQEEQVGGQLGSLIYPG